MCGSGYAGLLYTTRGVTALVFRWFRQPRVAQRAGADCGVGPDRRLRSVPATVLADRPVACYPLTAAPGSTVAVDASQRKNQKLHFGLHFGESKDGGWVFTDTKPGRSVSNNSLG